MKAFIVFVVICVVLADDCGYFACACNSESKSVISYTVTNDETRKGSYLLRTVSFYDSEKCEGNSNYEQNSEYSLTFVSNENGTNIYNRKMTSNVLKLTTEKAVSELGCQGISAGSSIDLLKEEDRNKCQAEKLQSFILPEEDQFPFVLNGINLVHPESSDNHCEMLNVDSCYVIYPERYVLIPMYVTSIIITIIVIVVYSIIWAKRDKTLPITQKPTVTVQETATPQNVEEKKEENGNEAPKVEVETPAVPESVANLENAASQAASVIL